MSALLSTSRKARIFIFCWWGEASIIAFPLISVDFQEKRDFRVSKYFWGKVCAYSIGILGGFVMNLSKNY